MADKIIGDGAVTLRGQVRRAFETPSEFASSPLYRALSRTVAAEDGLLDLASRGRHGQYPTFLFFGAVHYLLLSGVEDPSRRSSRPWLRVAGLHRRTRRARHWWRSATDTSRNSPR